MAVALAVLGGRELMSAFRPTEGNPTVLGLYRDNRKENVNYYGILG